MISRFCWFFSLACSAAVLTLASLAPTPARADFFDGARQTFTTGIPHFFQDDIPCAFGGKPTSGTKTSCHSSDQPARKATDQYQPPPPPPPVQSAPHSIGPHPSPP
jgi:hypothetical protein